MGLWQWLQDNQREQQAWADIADRLKRLEDNLALLLAPTSTPALKPRKVRRHDCGHESESYATRDGVTECEWCYMYRLHRERPQKAPKS